MPLGRDHDLLREGRDTVDEGDLRAMARLGASSDEAALQGDRLDAVAGATGDRVDLRREPIEPPSKPIDAHPCDLTHPTLTHTVVVGRGAPEPATNVTADDGLAVDHDGGDPGIARLDLNRPTPFRPRHRRHHVVQRDLVPGDDMALRAPRGRPAGDRLDEQMGLPFGSLRGERDRHVRARARSEVDVERAPLDPPPVDLDRPPQLQTREIGEGIPVGDPDPLAAEMLDGDRPSAPGELSHGRMRDEVGPDETVDAEVRIVRFVAEVTAVGPEEAAVVVGLSKALVTPVPQVATGDGRLVPEEVEVLVE